MRRLVGLLFLLMAMVPAIPGMAGTSADYRDDFGDGNYSGNDGSLEFADPWVEFGDNGAAGSGLVHLGPENCSNNECLHVEGHGLVAATYGATRYGDLSMFESVTLSFDVQIVPQGLTTTELWVEVHNGSQWKVVRTFDLAMATNQHKDIDVTQHASDGSAVRFRVLDALGGGLLGLDLFYTGYVTIDRVTLSGVLATSPTTSTTAPITTTSTRPTTTSSGPSVSTTSVTGPTPTTAGFVEEGTAAAQQSPGATIVSTTTTIASVTTTSEDGDLSGVAATGPLPPAGPSPRPPGSGLRVTAGGVIAGYQKGMMADLDTTGVEVLGVEMTADFSMAVELFETARIWIAGLALVIAAAIIGGLDRRRPEG